MKTPSFKDVRAPAGAVLQNWPVVLGVGLSGVLLVGLLMSGDPVIVENDPLDIPAPELEDVGVTPPPANRDLDQRAARARAEAIERERRARAEEVRQRRDAAQQARDRAAALAQAQQRLAALRARDAQPGLPGSPSDPIDVVARSAGEADMLANLRSEEMARRVNAFRMPAVVSSARGIGERAHAVEEAPPLVRQAGQFQVPLAAPAPAPPQAVPPTIGAGGQGFPSPPPGPDPFGSDDQGLPLGPDPFSVPPAGTPGAVTGASAGAAAGGRPDEGVIVFPSDGASYRLYEGTLIPAVLQTQLDGEFPGDVSAQVSRHVYSTDRQRVLIPRGTVALGSTPGVQNLWQGRLPVGFHRLVFPDGSWVYMTFNGLNGVGESSLKDQVDRHYAQVFGAAGAVGLLAGLSQSGGSVGGFRSAASEQIAATALTIVQQFLNRLPTVTIRAGHRINIRLMSDLVFPPESAWNVD